MRAHLRSGLNSSRGIGLIEVLVATALFATLGTMMYLSFTGLIQLLVRSRIEIMAVELVREQVEIVRNLPYDSVGEVNGIPAGSLPSTKTVSRGGFTFTVDTTVLNVDDPFDGTVGGSPNDTASADYKRVEISVGCTSTACAGTPPVTFTTTQAPKSLESTTSSGALFVRVLDANGTPIPNASVYVLNQATNPDTVVSDTTDNDGWLRLVGVPPGNNAYEVTASKSGFSTDRTYPPNGAGLSNPSKPHATVSVGVVTQLTFSIDQLGSMGLRVIADNCAPVPNLTVNLRGAKTLGTNSGSTVYKYNQNFALGASGVTSIANLEWDSYLPTITTSGWYVSGSVPVTPLAMLPGENADLAVVAEAASPRILVVSVKDGSTGLPVTDASVAISRSGFTTQTQFTGRGFINQTAWNGGSGQTDFASDATKYFDSDGNVSINSGSGSGYGAAGELRLRRLSSNGSYVTSGSLTSSTFDTGSASNFHQILWAPTNQQSGTLVRMQVATSDTNDGDTVWEFKGPDGTADTYYTTTSSNLHSSHDGQRYLRYKVFLSTTNSSRTPTVSDVNFTFTSDCVPPGQVMFSGLSSSSNHTYTVTVSKSGYNNSVTTKQLNGNWQEHSVTITP